MTLEKLQMYEMTCEMTLKLTRCSYAIPWSHCSSNRSKVSPQWNIFTSTKLIGKKDICGSESNCWIHCHAVWCRHWCFWWTSMTQIKILFYPTFWKMTKNLQINDMPTNPNCVCCYTLHSWKHWCFNCTEITTRPIRIVNSMGFRRRRWVLH